MLRGALAFFLLIVWSSQVFALPPAADDYPYRPKSDWLSGPEMQPEGFGPLRLPVPRPAPETQFDAPWKVILVLVDFKNLVAPAGTAYYTDMLFGKHGGDMSEALYKNQSMAEFYESMSGGKLTFEEPLVFHVTLEKEYEYYTRYSGSDETFRGCHGLGEYPIGIMNSGAVKIVEFVVDHLVESGVDLTEYDNDGDGQLDGLFIVHAGAGGEQTYWYPCLKNNGITTQGGDIWSHQYKIAYDVPIVDEKGKPTTQTFFINYLMGPAKSASGRSTTGLSAMGVWAHEFGHMLHLPDLYAETDGYGVGCWDLMGYAILSCSQDFFGEDPGEDPNELSVWSRTALGWSAPIEVTENVCNRRVDPTQFGGETFKVIPDESQPSDYFLVEYRAEVGMDKDLLSDFSVENRNRVCVWHVDDSIIGGVGKMLPNKNACFPEQNRAECKLAHYGLAVVEHDKNESLALGRAYLEPGDCLGPNSEMSTDDYEGMKTWAGNGQWTVRTGVLATQGSISIIVDPNQRPVTPVFASRPRSAERGSTWRYQPKLVESAGMPQWRLTEYPAGMTMDANTGLTTWKVPHGFSKDSVRVTVRVENCGGSKEQSFVLAVYDPEVRGCACSTTGRLPSGGEVLPFALLGIAWGLRRRGS